MKITRKLFYNKRNGQASITLPSKVLKELHKNLTHPKKLDKISLNIIKPQK